MDLILPIYNLIKCHFFHSRTSISSNSFYPFSIIFGFFLIHSLIGKAHISFFRLQNAWLVNFLQFQFHRFRIGLCNFIRNLLGENKSFLFGTPRESYKKGIRISVDDISLPSIEIVLDKLDCSLQSLFPFAYYTVCNLQ